MSPLTCWDAPLWPAWLPPTATRAFSASTRLFSPAIPPPFFMVLLCTSSHTLHFQSLKLNHTSPRRNTVDKTWSQPHLSPPTPLPPAAPPGVQTLYWLLRKTHRSSCPGQGLQHTMGAVWWKYLWSAVSSDLEYSLRPSAGPVVLGSGPSFLLVFWENKGFKFTTYSHCKFQKAKY